MFKRQEDDLDQVFMHPWQPTGLRWFTILAVSLVILSPGRRSVAAPVSGYVGGGIGLAFSTFDTGHFTFGQPDLSSSETAWRVFGGAQVHRYFGVEAGYVGFGKAHAAETGGQFFEAELTGFDLTPIGILPIGMGFSAFARAGLVFWNSDESYNFAMEGPGTKTESGSSLALGLGARFDITGNLGVRAEYMRYAIKKTKSGLGDCDFIAVSGLFVFGRR